MRYTGKKNRIARRFGVNIFGRTRNPLVHKQNPPGMHGARRRKKSDFGLQLQEKQKLKAVYGMLTEKQLKRYYRKAEQREGNTVGLLMASLESRLDIVIYRMKFASTIFAAQQLVSHGHILVNGKRVDIRSFQVKPGMVVTLAEKAQKIPAVISAQNQTKDIPEYLELASPFQGKFLIIPDTEQAYENLPLEINVPLVCEFLAHTS